MQINSMDEVSVPKSKNEVDLEFYVAVPTLEELSSFAIAIELWREEVNQVDPKNMLILPQNWDLYNKPSDDEELKKKLRKILPTSVPSKILDIITSCFQVIECETYHWTTYYCEKVAIQNITFCDLMFCIWLPNGLIDEHNTALNMLSNPSRSFCDKFKIMCLFCLEDEIKKLSISSITKHRYHEMVFPEHMIDIIKLWFSFMRRFRALSKSLRNVEREFWIKKWKPPRELLTWFRLGYEYDTAAYVLLLEALLETSAYRVKQIEYLIELWNCSPDHLKRRSRRATSICEKVFQMHVNWKRKSYRKPCSKDFEFLWIFLSSGSAQFKRNFIFTQKLSIVFMDFSTIDRLFKICLPNVNNFVEYKRFLVNTIDLPEIIDIKPFMNAFKAVARFILRYFPDQSERERLNFITKFISAFNSEETQNVQRYLEAIKLIEETNEVQPYRFHS